MQVDGTLVARTALPTASATYLPVTIVVAEEGSKVDLLEEISSADGGAGWFGGIVEIQAGQASEVRYANLQLLGDGAWNIGAQRVVVGQDANVTTLNAEVGSKVTKVGLDVQMTGKGGTSRLLGLLAAGDDQHIDINSEQDLHASYTTSDLLYLSALYDRARAAFYGVTRVRAGSRQTSSYQECRNLLLSPEAGAEPIPVLEIETNDILRCGHGATAGAIDPVQLFYAQTRGLDHDSAERMIVRGFFEQVVSQIRNETIRARVLSSLAGRIGYGRGRGGGMTALEHAPTGFVTVARAAEVTPGTVRVIEVDGRSLCLGLTEDGEWGAIDNVCTHDGGTLGEGELDDSAVECPRHGGRFDLFTGRVLALPPVRPVNAYEVRLDGDEVRVNLGAAS